MVDSAYPSSLHCFLHLTFSQRYIPTAVSNRLEAPFTCYKHEEAIFSGETACGSNSFEVINALFQLQKLVNQ